MEARLSIHPEALELAGILRSEWSARSIALRDSGVPVNEFEPRTIEEFEQRQTEIRSRIAEIDTEYAGKVLTDERRSEWDRLNEEIERNDVTLAELRVRHERVQELAGQADGSERGVSQFATRRPTASGDIWDLASLRHMAPQDHDRTLRDNAMRAVEVSYYPHEGADQARTKEHISRLIDRFAGMDEMENSVGLGGGNVMRFCRHLLATGNPTYRKAFRKQIRGVALTPDEQRALSLTGASGGFAVPYQLDPTIIPTSNLSVNPYRAIARVETITVDEWRGVSSAGVVAAYAAEAAEATDNAPTLAQPIVSTERCQAFVPYSFEVGQDWGSLESEMATLIQDAKDDVEATKFTLGSGTNEPFGVITGATTLTTAAGTATFAIADLYTVENALGPRFRPRAQWLANRSTYNRARQFDTAGGSGVWERGGLGGGLPNNVPTPGNLNATLIGYPANECSAVATALTTGTKIAVLGDFRYFIIVDRIGMSISQIPHLFGTNRMPTGQSGLYAFWRNSSKVLDGNAFRTLTTG